MAAPSRIFANSYSVEFVGGIAHHDVALCDVRQRGSHSLPPGMFPAASEAEASAGDHRHFHLVHTHANGLCMLTAGNVSSTLPETFPITTCSVAVSFDSKLVARLESRGEPQGASVKKQSKKQAKNGPAPGSVKADAIVATLTFTAEGFEPITRDVRSCVDGQVLSLNNRLLNDGGRVVTDTSGTGYLAIIRPNGRFPPQPRDEKKKAMGEGKGSKKKRKAEEAVAVAVADEIDAGMNAGDEMKEGSSDAGTAAATSSMMTE
jgi:hypothetical protein